MIRLRLWITGFILFFLAAPMICPISLAGGIEKGGEWKYDLFLGGDKVGTCIVTSTPAKDGILETRSNVKFEITQSGQTIQISLEGRTTYSWPGGHPRTSNVKLTTNASPETSFTGQYGDKESTITTSVAGQKFPTVLETKGDEYVMDNNFLMDHYAVLLSSVTPPEGKAVALRFIAPQLAAKLPKILDMTLSCSGIEAIKLGGVDRKALKLSGQAAGFSANFWIDPNDHTLLRWAVPEQQAEVVLSTGERTEAKPVDMDRMLAKMIEKLYLPAYLDMGRFQDVADLKARIKICAVSEEGFPKDAPKQVFEGKIEDKGMGICIDGVVRTSMTKYDGAQSQPLSASSSGSDSSYLKTTADIPANNPDIIKAAKEAAQGAATRWEAAAAVASWVHSHIVYEITGAGALNALEKRRGDCGPQSLLSLAMMRSLGIPSRIVGGILYVGGKFGQHNWVEVLVRPGQWIPIDPTTGEIGRFSASHIILWRGMGALAPDAAPMEIEVLAFAKAD